MADGNRRYKSDKKLYKVSFKLSEEDKRLLEEGAKKAGMNISEYLRNLVRGGGNVDASFTTDRGNFIRQITGIATNVNQIAKVVNTQGYGYTRDILAVKQDLEDVKRLMREVLMVWQSLRYSARMRHIPGTRRHILRMLFRIFRIQRKQRKMFWWAV